jgi:16S rRNA (guanine527-N7)-methyltransferase
MKAPEPWTQGLDPPTLDRLSLFVDLILEWNSRINLTGFKDRRSIEERLIGESVYALSHLDLSRKQVVDFGSGAGIPGIVWAICEPTVKITSVEIRQKKAAFQKEVVRKTGIPMEVVAGEFPQVVANQTFDVAVTRAVRIPGSLLEKARLRLVPGGILVRFAPAGYTEPGCDSIPISTRSVVLVQRFA